MNKRITATTNKRYNRKHGLKQKKKKVFRSGPTNVNNRQDNLINITYS